MLVKDNYEVSFKRNVIPNDQLEKVKVQIELDKSYQNKQATIIDFNKPHLNQAKDM